MKRLSTAQRLYSLERRIARMERWLNSLNESAAILVKKLERRALTPDERRWQRNIMARVRRVEKK